MKLIQYAAPTDKREHTKSNWLRGGLVTKEVLESMYIGRQMSSGDIGKFFGVSSQTVCNKIKKYGIERRPFADQLEGRKFGRWTVIRRIENDKKGRAQWLCICECGRYGTSKTSILKNGMSKSCGCLHRELARSRSGVNHPSYKTGRTNKEGYVLVLDRLHPNANKRGRVLEHTIVMSKYLGRPILPGETVHHKNGVRNDNRLENLELWTGKHTPGVRVADMVEFCVDYLNQYAPEKLARLNQCAAN